MRSNIAYINIRLQTIRVRLFLEYSEFNEEIPSMTYAIAGVKSIQSLFVSRLERERDREIFGARRSLFRVICN